MRNSPVMLIKGQTKRLTFELLTVDHASELTGLLDPRLNRYFAAQDVPLNLEDLRQRFAAMAAYHSQPDDCFHNYTVRAGGTCIGRLEASVRGINAEIAYLFVPDAWGHGFASEAVNWLQVHLGYCFDIRRFWVCISPSNGPSIRLAKGLGYEIVPEETWPELGSYETGDTVLSAAINALP
jgi:[ribosomal protein S5]-alanine N-acetyltransferase